MIPKSVHSERQKENLEAWGRCRLDEVDVGVIEGMVRVYGNGRFNNPCAMMGMHCFEGLEADPVPARRHV